MDKCDMIPARVAGDAMVIVGCEFYSTNPFSAASAKTFVSEFLGGLTDIEFPSFVIRFEGCDFNRLQYDTQLAYEAALEQYWTSSVETTVWAGRGRRLQ